MRRFFQIIDSFEHQVLGINQRNAGLVYPNNPTKHYHLADDKIRTKETLRKMQLACAPTYAVISRFGEIEQVWKDLQQYDKLAIKPANGKGGGGIMVLKKNNDGQWISGGRVMTDNLVTIHIANTLAGVYSMGSKDRVLIEYCITPDPFFKTIYPGGVPDYRVIMLHDQPIMAMLRVPTKRSNGKANLHQGGLGIGIDMEKGILLEGFDGTTYSRVHPDSKSQIYGKNIPGWEAIMELSLKTAQSFPLKYLGIDIVVDEQLGPLIMEINIRPGLGIQVVNRMGLKAAVEARFPDFFNPNFQTTAFNRKSF